MSQVSHTVLTTLGEYLDLNICSLEFLGGLKCVAELYFGNLLLGPAIEESAAGCAAGGRAAGLGGLEPTWGIGCPTDPALPLSCLSWAFLRFRPGEPLRSLPERSLKAAMASEVAAVWLSLFLGRSRTREEL